MASARSSPSLWDPAYYTDNATPDVHTHYYQAFKSLDLAPSAQTMNDAFIAPFYVA